MNKRIHTRHVKETSLFHDKLIYDFYIEEEFDSIDDQGNPTSRSSPMKIHVASVSQRLDKIDEDPEVTMHEPALGAHYLAKWIDKFKMIYPDTYWRHGYQEAAHTISYLYSDIEKTYQELAKMKKNNGKNVKQCKCPMQLIMASGCQCGATKP